MAILDSKVNRSSTSESSPGNVQYPDAPGSHHQSYPQDSQPNDGLPPYEAPTRQPLWAQRPDFRQPKTRKRALKFAAITLIAITVAYLLFGMSSPSRGNGGSGSGQDSTPYVPPSQGKPVHDGNWSSSHKVPNGNLPEHWPSSSLETFQSTTDFDVSISTKSVEALFLHAYGPNYQGTLTIDTNSKLPKDSSHVHIIATYHNDYMLDTVAIKQLVDGKAQGVGIYGPKHWTFRGEEDRLRIDVVWTLPQDVTLPGLSTDLDALSTIYKPHDLLLTNWKHSARAGSLTLGTATAREFIEVHNDAGSVNVLDSSSRQVITTPRLDVHTNAGSVHFNDITAEQNIEIVTDAGSVSTPSGSSPTWITPKLHVRSNAGSFHHYGRIEPPSSVTQSSIDIQTDAGTIQANTYVVYDKLSLRTNAGSIRADMELASPPKQKEQHHPIDVKAFSDAGSVRLTYTKQDPQVDLHSHARSSTGSVQVAHHPAYLGSFELQSSVGSVKYQPPNKSGSRDWKIDYDQKGMMGRHLKGVIFQKDSDPNRVRGSTVLVADVGSVTAEF